MPHFLRVVSGDHPSHDPTQAPSDHRDLGIARGVEFVDVGVDSGKLPGVEANVSAQFSQPRAS
ncbi:hypothetical protein [Mycobacterium heckeshornense]|uniref:hypothetical protein n=1 Tax=Mycobacterium heckeshornense TaxID=110505 RepID=UPI0019102E3E|nr:hypothetical protein [Mycobacterium heckeshornense]